MIEIRRLPQPLAEYIRRGFLRVVRRAGGLCTRCGKDLRHQTSRRATCDACTAKGETSERAWRTKNPTASNAWVAADRERRPEHYRELARTWRQRQKLAGRCSECVAEAVDGAGQCAKHLVTIRAKGRRYMRRRREREARQRS